MSTTRSSIDRLSTGSAAFDLILGGGLPARSLTLVAGEPGSGKTLFAMQMLFHQARLGKKTLYLTSLSDPSLKLVAYMRQFSFFDESLLGKDGVVMADLGSVVRRKGVEATLGEIVSRVEREEPSIVVIDSFKAVRDIIGESTAVRTFVYDLAVHTAAWGAASLFIGEYTANEIANYSEFAIADGIIRMSNRRQELSAIREVEILKLRGADYRTGGHFFEIGSDGLAFFPRVRGPDAASIPEPADADVRVTTGAPGLDEMLGGGLPRASTTVVQGGTGTGKTLLGLQYLMEGARLGEPGIHFTLEETPGQLRRVAGSLGWDLAPLERRGLLTFRYVSPVELSTDVFLDRARQEVERLGAKRAVLDSLTSMALGVPSDRRFKELVFALTKHFRAAGVTLTMNMEVADLLGAGQLSGHGISFAADNVVQLKYVEVGGRLERGIAVLKARGVKHATEMRRLAVGPQRVDAEVGFAGLRGVLTGLPVRAEDDRGGRAR